MYIIASAIINLGANPKNGGNPPKDKKLIIKKNFSNVLLIKIIYIWLI